jgi:hypothetical protein
MSQRGTIRTRSGGGSAGPKQLINCRLSSLARGCTNFLLPLRRAGSEAGREAGRAGRPVGGKSIAHDHESTVLVELDAEETPGALMDSAGVAVARPEDTAGKEAGGRWLRARGDWNKGLSLLRRVAAVAEPAVTVGFNVAGNNSEQRSQPPACVVKILKLSHSQRP